MILTKYELKRFVKEYETKLREPLENLSDKEVFKELKEELLEYLKTFDESLDLHVFEDLNVYLEGISLCFSYKETTGQPMKVRLIRRVNDLTVESIKEYVHKFIKEDLGGSSIPSLSFPNTFNYQNLGMYWPDEKIITISSHMYMQHDQKEVESILRHEAIHHYLNEKGLPASDNDDEFIELVLKHDAYISLEASAQASLVKFVREKERKDRLAKQKEARIAKKKKESESESESEEQDD